MNPQPSHDRRPPSQPAAALRRIAATALFALAIGLFIPAAPARAAGFVVTTTADSGAGSLRDAIDLANSNAGLDTISFNIPGTGVQTIAPTTQLPTITDPVVIDGATQPGASCASWPPTLLIELTGRNILLPDPGPGLAIVGPSADGSTIRGLVVNGIGDIGSQSGDAIHITDSSGNAIECMFLGTDPSGTSVTDTLGSPLYNGMDIIINGSSSNNRIGTNGDGVNDAGERNLICGGRAILSLDSANHSVIAGNYIGTDVTGTQALCPGSEVVVLNDIGNNRIGTNGDGVSDIAERNIILGSEAIWIIGSSNNIIAGNYVGTDVTGMQALSSSLGVELNGGDANIIGTDGSNDAFNANEGNLISGNVQAGVWVGGASNTVVAGNRIGTNAAGTAKLGNDVGVLINGGSTNTRVGTNGDGVADAAEANVIAGSALDGIQIGDVNVSTTTVNTVVRGNYIGTDPTGTLDLGNANSGISVVSGNDAVIGGPVAGQGNIIRFNTGAGVLLADSTAHATIRGNSIDANGNRGIIAPGVPFPIVTRAMPSGSSLRATGVLTGTAASAYALDFYASPSCDTSFFGEGRTYLGSQSVTTDAAGAAEFDLSFTPAVAVPFGQFITAAATSPAGATSAFSNCSSAGPGNDAWPRAYNLDSGAPFSQPLDLPGQSRWFTLPAAPGSRMVVNLTGADGGPLPAGYDLTVYKDISQAFTSLATPQDLTRLTAEFAGDGFNNDTLERDALNPARVAPQAYSPQAYSPQAYSPQAYSPQAYSPQAYSPQAYSPQAYSPQAYSPQAYSPQAYSPEQLAYANAQVRSVVGIAAHEGTAPRTITLNTWNNTGEFYVQVRGQNGAFTPLAPFRVQATVLDSQCPNVQVIPAVDPGVSGSYNTVILADLSRVEGSPADKAALAAKLQTLAQQENGILIDVGDTGSYPRVQDARAEVASNLACPFAKNQLAEKIKALYRNVTGLQYVVIVGDDNAIPFFNSPDNAPLGPESNYEPPLLDNSAAQASLRLNYILSQDAYGSRTTLSFGNDSLPVPEIPVGRLVEDASDINAVLEAYLVLTDGLVPPPTSALVTSYDFLQDAGEAVRGELSAGLGSGATVDTLVSPNSESFLDPEAWTGSELRTQLLGSRHDLIFLAGHFSAASTLAADYRTTLEAAEVAESSIDLTNVIVWSAGCHSGYNLVNSAAVPDVTRSLDWAQAFAQKGATLIAGTGYQYGDTEFLAYSERIYSEFSRQLRVGTGPVSIGDALVAAKQAYLTSTPQLQGIDDKSLRIATIYGLPMLKVDMPGLRLPAPSGGPSALAPTVVSTGPGNNPAVGLRSADLPVTTGLTSPTAIELTNIDDGLPVSATYYSGPDGVAIRPAEPVLPLKRVNVGVSNTVLRGVGFRGGSYADTGGVRPLVSAPTYDLRGVHSNFAPPVFWPVKPFAANYFGTLIDPATGTTELQLTPVQFRTSSPTDQTGTRRVFSTMDFRLFYSSFLTSYGNGSAPALSNGPAIAKITSTITGTDVLFSASVVGDPAAGMQSVWVTWTDPTAANPRWQSLDLTQSTSDTTLWAATLSGANSATVRYVVQAVSAMGVVTMADNFGAFFSPGLDSAAPPTTMQQPATLTLTSPPASSAYGTQASFSAQLASASVSTSGRTVVFSLGSQSKVVTTNSSGSASATFELVSTPGQYQVGVSFQGGSDLAAAGDSASFTITKQNTELVLTPSSATVPVGAPSGIIATLSDVIGTPLALRTVFFTVGTLVVPATTNALGQAALGSVNLPPGSYSVRAAFGTNQVPGVTQIDSRYNGSNSASGTLVISGSTDTTAPVITPSVSGTLGQNDWYTSDVSVSWSVVDAESPIASSSGCGPTTITADTVGTTLTCSASSDGGSASQSVTIKRDATAPTVAITSAPPALTNSTSASFVFSSNESGSSLACKLDTGAFMPCVSGQSYSGLANGAHTFTVQATDPASNTGAAVYNWTITVAPPAFPQNGIRDNFNRANGGVGSNWEGLSSTTFYKIASNRLDVQVGGPLVWKTPAFGTSQEAYVTLSMIDSHSPSQGVLLKVQTSSIPSAGAISVVYDAVAKAVRVSTLRLNTPTWTLYANQLATFANGDRLGAQILASGDVKIYRNGTLVTTVTLNAADKAFFNTKGGKVGLWTAGASNALFDDFGGGSL